MSLTVYGVPLSPFVRKVRLCLAELELAYQLEMISPFDQPDWFFALNPLGRIPALKDDELTLADSSVICQYIAEKYTGVTPLLGQNAEQHAKVRWFEKYVDYELAPLTTFTIFQQRVINPSMGKPTDETVVSSALSKGLPVHFNYLEQALGDEVYFVGDTLTLADIAFACQIVNMEHGGEVLDNNRWPNLADLYTRIKASAAMQDLLPEEHKILTSILSQ